MQLPSDERDRAKIKQFCRVHRDDPTFLAFIGWIHSEREKYDIQNRVRGFENKTTGAQALAFIEDTVAAFQAPEKDRNSQKQGAESITSAGLPM